MENEIAIRVDDIYKSFRVYYDKGHSLKERILFKKRNAYEERSVINGMSFQIKKGESVGLIGHNGCGKSTTLKLLTRIIYPDRGLIEMNGRVSSLLELGAGFHPDLSGRENIYINASIFGLSRKEIDKRVDDIIRFSELEEYIENPVRTYSSGMYMRLAFSVAINVDADILLIDEILAVGDVNFQTKCFNKLVDIKKQGTTIVLVSHSAEQIERICERSIWIQDGKIMMDGAPRDVNRAYMIHMGELREEMLQATVEQEEETDPESAGCPNDRQAEEAPNAGHHRGSGEAFLQEVYTTDSSGKRKSVFQTGEAVVFHLSYLQKQAVPESYFGLSIFRNDGIRCYGTNTEVDGIREYILEGDGEMCVTFPSLQLLSGSYYVDVCIAKTNWEMIDYYDTTCSFEVFHTDQDIGMVRLSHSWQLNPAADGRNTPACPSGKDERDDH